MIWTPAHVGVEGNERADEAAKEAAVRPPAGGIRGRYSLAFLKRRTTEKMTREWREDTITRMRGKSGGEKNDKGRGAFCGPGGLARPRIRGPLRGVEKRVASVFFQLLSGHAMIAPFLKEKWGWIDSDRCWWCNGGRQSRDHLFKECTMWKKEITELWSEVGRIAGKRGMEKMKGRTGTAVHSRAGRVSAFTLDRQGRGQATPRSGSCFQAAGTVMRFWTF